MCSGGRGSPLNSGGSVIEPFFAVISTVINGTAWFSPTTTVSPFGHVCCWIFGGSVVLDDATRNTAGTSASMGGRYLRPATKNRSQRGVVRLWRGASCANRGRDRVRDAKSRNGGRPVRGVAAVGARGRVRRARQPGRRSLRGW